MASPPSRTRREGVLRSPRPIATFAAGMAAACLLAACGGGSTEAPEDPGTPLDRFAVQVAQIWKGSREGGFFLMVGRKTDE